KVGLSQERAAHEIGQHLHRERQVGVEHVGLVAGGIATGVGVEAPAPYLERQRQLARIAPLRALEHEVLEQVCRAKRLRNFVRAGGTYPYAYGCRAQARQPFRYDDETIRRCGAPEPLVEAERLHQYATPSGAAPSGRAASGRARRPRAA